MDGLTEAELGYLAGLVDGEGCINIAKTQGRYYVLQIVIAQSNEYLLDYWQKKTGLGTIHHMKRRANGVNDSEKWHWHLSTGNAQKMLDVITPYLVLKQEEAMIALEFLQVCKHQESQYRGRGVKRITPDMLKIREAYKNALHKSKSQRAGAELERELTINFEPPPSAQLSLL